MLSKQSTAHLLLSGVGVLYQIGTQQPKVDLEPIYDKPIQTKKEVKIDDLHKETKETRSEIGALKQNLQAIQRTQSM